MDTDGAEGGHHGDFPALTVAVVTDAGVLTIDTGATERRTGRFRLPWNVVDTAHPGRRGHQSSGGGPTTERRGEPGERAALLMGLLADGDDAVALTAAHSLRAMPSAPISNDAIAAVGRHRHPEARRLAGELLSRNASGRSAEGRPGE